MCNKLREELELYYDLHLIRRKHQHYDRYLLVGLIPMLVFS